MHWTLRIYRKWRKLPQFLNPNSHILGKNIFRSKIYFLSIYYKVLLCKWEGSFILFLVHKAFIKPCPVLKPDKPKLLPENPKWLTFTAFQDLADLNTLINKSPKLISLYHLLNKRPYILTKQAIVPFNVPFITIICQFHSSIASEDINLNHWWLQKSNKSCNQIKIIHWTFQGLFANSNKCLSLKGALLSF